MGKHIQDSEVRTRNLIWGVWNNGTLIGTYTDEVEARVHAAAAPGSHVIGCGA